MKNYGSNKRHSDPIVHFYEDFLAEYDPKLRKARSVWYTPAPVVKFIVKSVDEILQQEFGLARGLADDSKVLMDVSWEQSRDKRFKDGVKHEKVEVPRVQILDPATGTGTFLAEVIEQIRDKFNGLEGLWPSYVEKNLIHRIHGFEILMASYTIAHLKLALTLKNTGYDRSLEQRLNVFLTNSLEEATPRSSTLFSKWLSDEADAASEVKTKSPIMIAIGNPPYSISSQNSGKWITDLVEDYKRNLNERNIQPLSDDYIKFLRLGQYYIHKNGEGVLAYISNNGFQAYTTDDSDIANGLLKATVHGNNRRRETSYDGSPDENVFDIMQGVSINLFVKTGKKEKGTNADVFYFDVFGTREIKYDFLCSHSLSTTLWQPLDFKEPYWIFVPKDFSAEADYSSGFSINDLFSCCVSGIMTSKDFLFVKDSSNEITPIISDLKSCSIDEFRKRYNVTDSRDWSVERAKDDILHNELKIVPYLYRPFERKLIPYTGLTNGLIAWPRKEGMDNLIEKNGLGLVLMRKQQNTDGFQAVFITKDAIDNNFFGFRSFVFPITFEKDHVFGFSEEITKSIRIKVGSAYSDEALFHFVYAVLHSPHYRKQFKEFLKIDFPRISYPKDAEQFRRLAEKGVELRKLHLMEGACSWNTGVGFPVAGTNTVEKVSFADGRVFINAEQYFSCVSELAWNFFIGGYQPAQKWLKDRKGRTLEYEDILHYGRIIYALQETDRIMKEIDEIGVV